MQQPENFSDQHPDKFQQYPGKPSSPKSDPCHTPMPEAQSSENLTALYEDLGTIQNDFRNKNLYAFLASQLKAGSLLDIGCGAGHFLDLASKKGLEATGIEPNPSLIALAKKLYGGSFNIQHGGANQIERMNALRYDNITMLDVLEHIQDDELLLKKLRPFLKDEGQLLILVPCYRHLYGTRDKKLGHYRRYEKSELIEKLTANGYKIICCRFWNMLGYFAYAFSEKILRKEVPVSLRASGKKTLLQRILIAFLNGWLKHVESRLNLGFGLSLFCIATPQKKQASS